MSDKTYRDPFTCPACQRTSIIARHSKSAGKLVPTRCSLCYAIRPVVAGPLPEDASSEQDVQRVAAELVEWLRTPPTLASYAAALRPDLMQRCLTAAAARLEAHHGL